MNNLDRDTFLVLAVFGGSLLALIVGYLVAWRSKRVAYRKTGSLVAAVVAGFGGFFISMWLIGAAMPIPPPDGSSIWGPILFLLIFSPIPLGAFYISAKFVRQV
jgi:Na+/phosphate symporter